MKHNFKAIEKKWQSAWEKDDIFKAVDGSDKPKFYGLVEFPYPSGAGMHVGHIKAYSSVEVVSRKRRMQGYNVLFPIGFDAFGLPTENYAIKTNTHPRKITDDNIKKFTTQLKSVGFSFDYSRTIDTTQEDYYKWTQWIFLKMFEKGLVFRDKTLVNYCPHCKVVLSNEDSQGGKCDICHSDVVQREKSVWYLRITDYADKLLEGLDTVDFPENVKQQEVNWIGKSEGAFVGFSLKDIDEKLEIYTTRCDTLFGVTFMVIAPEHPLIDKYKDRLENLMNAMVEKVFELDGLNIIYSKRTNEPFMFNNVLKKGKVGYYCTFPDVIIVTEADKTRVMEKYDPEIFEVRHVSKDNMVPFLGGCFYINGAAGVRFNDTDARIPAEIMVEKPADEGEDYGNISNPDLVRWLLLMNQLPDEEKNESSIAFGMFSSKMEQELVKARFLIPAQPEGEGFRIAVQPGKGEKTAARLYTDWGKLRLVYDPTWASILQTLDEIIDSHDAIINVTGETSRALYLTKEDYERIKANVAASGE